LPDPWRGLALGVVGFGAYMSGDGPRAGIALEAALRCDPGNRMARLLDTALQAGMPPETVRKVLHGKGA